MCAILGESLNLWDNLGGPNVASYFCHLPSIATLNLILSSSLLSRFLYGKLNLASNESLLFPRHPLPQAEEKPPPPSNPQLADTETLPHYRRSTLAPHQLSGSSQKELEIDSSLTALSEELVWQTLQVEKGIDAMWGGGGGSMSWSMHQYLGCHNTSNPQFDLTLKTNFCSTDGCAIVRLSSLYLDQQLVGFIPWKRTHFQIIH